MAVNLALALTDRGCRTGPLPSHRRELDLVGRSGRAEREHALGLGGQRVTRADLRWAVSLRRTGPNISMVTMASRGSW